jgi:flagellar hook-associated protein FlgK
MELSTFFEIIGKYGWWSILIAAGIGLIYILVKLVANKITDGVKGGMNDVANKLTDTVTYQLQEMSSSNFNQMEMLSNNIAKQNTELVKAISNQNEKLLSYIMHKDTALADIHDRQVEKRIEVAESIIDKLKDIMNKTHSVRAFIIEFHNSYKNLAGSPFAKYTCTYEWFDKGLEQISTKIVGLPYSTMARIVGDVRRTGKHQKLYTDMKKMEDENPQLFSLVKDPHTTAIFYNTLYNEDNVMMGMLVIEWQTPLFTEKLWTGANMPNIIAQDAAELSMWINLQGPSIEQIELDNSN